MKVIVNESQYNKILIEQRGYSESLEKWADYVTDEVTMNILNLDETEDVFTFKKLKMKLGNQPFFDKLPIDSMLFSVVLEDSENDEANIDIYYNPYYTQIVEDDEGNPILLDVEFEAAITLPKDREEINVNTFKYYLSSFLSHEFMHVFEWFNRNLESPKELKSCITLYTSGNIHGDAVDRIAYLLYTSLSFELNSFVQQTSTMIRKLNPENRDEFMSILTDLPMYNFAQTMIDFNSNEYLQEINNLSDDRKSYLEDIVECYYSDQQGEVTLERFLKDIDRRFKIRGEGLKRKLLRLITVII
jgi:hypothetical protein